MPFHEMSDIYSETEVYHILEIVGKGTFGKVAKCWRGRDGELVAIKIMKTDADKCRVIKNELKLTNALGTANLDKCHIVKFYESFPGPRCHYLVFELLEKNLYQLQKENGFRPLAIRNIRTITHQVLKALAELKELGIIHADLKPENVMVVDQTRYPFRVKVIDFGSASLFHEVRFVREPYIQSRFYRSPEILLGLPFCEKVDMWSLGCIIAELFLGWPLYPGDSAYDQVRYICETQGIPSNHLLNSASKAREYFIVTKNSRGGLKWQLKPPATPPKGPDPKSGEKKTSSEQRKYIFSSLDEIKSVEVPQTGPGYRNEDMAAWIADRHCMVELLKRLLTLDSHQRINPSSALRHHFINMYHLLAVQEYQHYYDKSLRGVQEAMAPRRTSGGDGTKSRQSFSPDTQPQHPRGAFQPQRPIAKLEAKPHSGSCQAAFVGKHRGANSGATTSVQSQHNLVPSQVRTTTQQMDELCIMDEQDIASLDTPPSSSGESVQAYQTANEESILLEEAGPATKTGSGEEEGGAKFAHTPSQRERSLGKSIMSIFNGICAKLPTGKPSESKATPQSCRAMDGLIHRRSPPRSLMLPSQDSMSESDTAPPQDFQAETQDLSLEVDLATQDVLTHVLTQSTVDHQDNEIGGSLEPAKNRGVHAGDRGQPSQAGGEYVLQYVPYEVNPQAHQWPHPSGWVSEAHMNAYQSHGPSACSGHSSHSFFHF